jgi:hypothetical protein
MDSGAFGTTEQLRELLSGRVALVAIDIATEHLLPQSPERAPGSVRHLAELIQGEDVATIGPADPRQFGGL